jgi:hypothetical protein
MTRSASRPRGNFIASANLVAAQLAAEVVLLPVSGSMMLNGYGAGAFNEINHRT